MSSKPRNISPFVFKNAVLLLLCCIALRVHAQDLSEYKFASFTKNGHSLPYRLLYPLNFDPDKKYPLLVFLHGSYEKGTDNALQLNIGGRYFLRPENRSQYPAFVLFPQCPADDSWAYFETTPDSLTGLAKEWHFPFKKEPTQVSGLLKNLLDSLIQQPSIDPDGVYLGGLSQGGMGVFDLVARYPGMFAAAFPICGAGKVSTAKLFAKQVPLWIFHGDKDDIVPPRFSRDFYKQLQKQGAEVRYSEYPGVYHDSWLNAFGEKELLPWLFLHKRH
jgi:predicted peptidase